MVNSTILRHVLFMGICSLLSLNMSAQIIYVAPTGDDSNPGTQGQPLKSFSAAADMVAAQGATQVNFADGTYLFDATVVLNQAHSNTVFQGSANTVFSSLVKVTGWTPCQTCGNTNIMQAPVPVEAGISGTRYLHDAKTDWLERARSEAFVLDDKTAVDPGTGVRENNEAVAHVPDQQADKSLATYPSSFNIGSNATALASQYDIVTSVESWHLQMLPVASINTAQRRITTAIPSTYRLKDCFDPNGVLCTPGRALMLNRLEDINDPGEWVCLDNMIYLLPATGSDTEDIYVPKINTELVRIDGGDDQSPVDPAIPGLSFAGIPVTGIQFNNITFTGTGYWLRNYIDTEALRNTSTQMTMHDWDVVDAPASLLRIRNATNCTVSNCVFEKSGGAGVRLDRYAQNNTVSNSIFRHLGRTAVSLVGRGPGRGDVNFGNTVTFNEINNMGKINPTSPAIMLSQSSRNLIGNNTITRIPFSAVIFNGSRGIYAGEGQYWANDPDSDSRKMRGTEAHWHEVLPDYFGSLTIPSNAPEGSELQYAQAKAYFYNYDNIIEKNAISNVHTAGQTYWNDANAISNGLFYSTGGTWEESNTCRMNYFHSMTPDNTQLHYQDDYTSGLNIEKNFIWDVTMPHSVLFDVYNFDEGSASSSNPKHLVNVRSNVMDNSSFEIVVNRRPFGANFVIDTTNIVYGNNGNMEIPTPTGATYTMGYPLGLNDYMEMYTALCNTDIGHNPSASIPGIETLKSKLAGTITSLGGTVSCSSTGGGGGGNSCTGTTSILPFGNSLTEGFYRYQLFQKFVDNNYNYQWVGRDNTENPEEYPDYNGQSFGTAMHSGFSGINTVQALNGGDGYPALNSWLPNIPDTTDIVLLMLGTNDMSSELSANDISGIVSNVESIITAIRNDLPGVNIFLAKIIPRGCVGALDPAADPGACTSLNNVISQYNDSLQARFGSQTDITIVDMFSGFDTSPDMFNIMSDDSPPVADNYHPGPVGQDTIASRWWRAIETFCGGSNNGNGGTCPAGLETLEAPEVGVVNSECDEVTNMPSGGVLSAPSGCPSGTTIQYSIDEEQTWSTSLPSYDQSEEMAVFTRCTCDSDPTISSLVTEIFTEPDVCEVMSIYQVSGGMMSIYPNPATDFIYIEAEGVQSYSVSLYNAQGRLLSTSIDVEELSMSSFQPGIYMLIIEDQASGEKITKKILKK